MIDGSGVLADPRGIDRAELVRLAKLRKTVSFFNTAKLSKEGYLVKLEDQDVKLPCMSSPSIVGRLILTNFLCSWRDSIGRD